MNFFANLWSIKLENRRWNFIVLKFQYDIEAEKQAFVDYKLSRLESLEARWRADMDREPGYYATSYSSWLNYGTSLMTNVIENLQLNIKDVHLRFEDGTSSNGNISIKTKNTK